MLTSIAWAQNLRLGDVFTTPTLTKEHGTLARLDEAGVKERLTLAEADLAAGRPDAVLQSTELLTAWLDRKSVDYARALFLRARAYDAQGQTPKVMAITTDYLTQFTNGTDRGWFLIRLAEEKEKAGAPADAGVIWQRVLKEEVSVSPEQALTGARLLLGIGDGKSARKILQQSEDAPMDDLLRREREGALMETLLMDDDLTIDVPPARELRTPQDASCDLQRALLLELRGRGGEAAVEYDALVRNLALLTNDERSLLATRTSARSPWPPPSN